MSAKHLLFCMLHEVAEQLQSGKLCTNDVVRHCIQRMKDTRHLNAFVTELHDEALKQANKTDERLASGERIKLLDGIPIAVKDNYCVKDVKSTCASYMLHNFYPSYSATVVQRLQDQGACVIGKTNLDEFAMGAGTVDSIHGPVYNPWSKCARVKHNMSCRETCNESMLDTSQDRQCDDSEWLIAGGSSGGSAVAVATGSCYAALGSDTGGSTRNPAAYCGIVGFKPTYGLLSRHGLIPLVNSLDVPCILTRRVEDAVNVFNVIVGHDELDSTTVSDPFNCVDLSKDIDISDLHIGIPREYHAPGVSADILETWQWVADIFSNAGAKVTEVSLPHTQYSIACYSILCCCEVASNMARYSGVQYGHRSEMGHSTHELYAHTRHEGFNDVVRGRVLAGNYFLLKKQYDLYFVQAQKVRQLISNDFKQAFDSGINLLLTPTTLTDAPVYNEFIKLDNRTKSARDDVLTQPVNLVGLPAIALPAKLSSRGLPTGVQLIADNFQDEELFRCSKWLESQMNFPFFDILN